MKNVIKKLAKFTKQLASKIIIKARRITRLDLNYFYNEEFATHPAQNKSWGWEFCSLIIKKFNPKSIIDFGCGTADLLAPFEKKGIDVFGIDGSRANRRHSKINKNNFLLFDIRCRYITKKKYDLCFCLEVAEHIEEGYSDILINSLSRSSPIVIFTAAPPGQNGLDHINLKPYEWWIRKFKQVRFNLDEELTNCLKSEMEKISGIQRYYIDNLLIFRDSGIFSKKIIF